MIQIDSVSKSFQNKNVLKNISLTFEKDRTHVLLGASGSGKSTLLRMIIGLIPPDSGSIWLDDLQISSAEKKITSKTRQEITKKIGYVIQDGGLFPHLSVLENITLVAKTLKMQDSYIKKRVDELLDIVSLDGDILGKYPSQLSGGQKQRIAVVRAAFLDPYVMLLDEPLGALDPIIRSNLQSELKNIFLRLKKLIILVTHDIVEAAFFGDTVTVLHEGTVLQHGTFRDLLDCPADPYISQFIQSQKSLYDLESYRQ